MPQITINGRLLDFEPGETIIQVATRNQEEIPFFCWHPELSVAANCRMCLVEVEKAPKLVPACQTECRDGMVVHTESDRVKTGQRAVHELILANHPLDCPICDQAGECKLQDYYMKYQLSPGQMQDPKALKPDQKPIGQYVVYNADRCILCTRCVRFMEEIAGERLLGVFNRGDRAHIGPVDGRPLDHPYSLNVVDICPVGALTSSVFRFKQRSWYLQRSPSLCPGCARGCNVHIDQRSGAVYRLLPRANPSVNKCWLCDEGRLTYDRANTDRLTRVSRRGGGGQLSAAQGVAEVVRLLGPVAQARQGLGAAISLHATCEDTYLFGRLAKEVLGVEVVALLEYGPGEADDLLRRADKNPNRAGVVRVLDALGLATISQVELAERIESGQIKALLCVGHEMDDAIALATAAARLEVVVHLAHATTKLAEVAQLTLPIQSWAQVDGTWINDDERVQRLYPAFSAQGDERSTFAWLSDVADGLGVRFPASSAQTIRVEMERNLDGFGETCLSEVDEMGRSLR